jgi:UDP-N-acetylglucosamine 4,6-dehydratase/5-epimerase
MTGKVILVTGGTGSFGSHMVEYLLKQCDPKKVIVYSRNEEKQVAMRRRLENDKLRFFVGDVRDLTRLERAFSGVDYVVHAAALKHVDVCAYNPEEAKKTNVDGAINVVNAAINTGVKKVLAISSDKAVNPTNTYGASKLLGDYLFTDGNALSGRHGTKFSVIRFGNFTNSSQSVIPHFKNLKNENSGVLPITDCRMTRYFISIQNAVQCALKALDYMEGGEIFIPKMTKVRIKDLALSIYPNARIEEVGRRPGEKLHEQLISEPDYCNLRLWQDLYVVNGRLGERVSNVCLNSSGAEECDLTELAK